MDASPFSKTIVHFYRHICGKFAHGRYQTYNDENPSPAIEACNALHEANALTCISKALA
jgi:hypothetical protein